MENPLTKLRSIADYQFGRGIGAVLFTENVQIEFSHATGKIRYISLDGKRIATLRPTDGLLSISVDAAQLLAKNEGLIHCVVTVRQDVAEYIAEGGDVFAVHVVKADEEIHAKDEVIAVDEAGRVLAVGRALLSSKEMLAFKTGVAVKVRHGSRKERES